MKRLALLLLTLAFIITAGPAGRIDAAEPHFDAARTIASGLGLNFQNVFADLDGDGDLDLVSISTNDPTGITDRVVWFENLDGRGIFGPERLISSQVAFVGSLAVGDIDGDGAIDVVFSETRSPAVPDTRFGLRRLDPQPWRWGLRRPDAEPQHHPGSPRRQHSHRRTTGHRRRHQPRRTGRCRLGDACWRPAVVARE